MLRLFFSLCFSSALLINNGFAQQTFSSGTEQVTLLELYTSEGCSSCPPADNWVSGLKSKEGLWETFIPLTFHVDYWDRLGWPDRFAKSENTARQYKHHKQGNIRQVYTPGFVLDGNEWRGWYSRRPLIASKKQPGNLSLDVNDNAFKANFSPRATALPNGELHIAIIGFNLKTAIKRGENRGRILKHDFVVLAESTYRQSGTNSWQGSLPILPSAFIEETKGPKDLAVVAWVTNPHSLKPIQAVGGWL